MVSEFIIVFAWVHNLIQMFSLNFRASTVNSKQTLSSWCILGMVWTRMSNDFFFKIHSYLLIFWPCFLERIFLLLYCYDYIVLHFDVYGTELSACSLSESFDPFSCPHPKKKNPSLSVSNVPLSPLRLLFFFSFKPKREKMDQSSIILSCASLLFCCLLHIPL